MVRDPSTETWRADINDATKAFDSALNQLGPPPAVDWRTPLLGMSISTELRQTQEALAASQADLTRVEAELAEARDEARTWRATAERCLAGLEAAAREMATVRYQNRILTAEKEADGA